MALLVEDGEGGGEGDGEIDDGGDIDVRICS